MATKLVIDFDCNLVASQSTAPTTWENCAKPVGVYAYAGIVTANPNIDNNPGGAGFVGVGQGRDALSGAYGNSGASNAYTFGTSPQIGVKRSKYGIGAEIYATFDVNYVLSGTNTGTLSSVSSSGIFRWGDITVRLYSVTYTAPNYTVVYRVYNGASVVATVTVPDVTSAVWHYCKIHAKLDATTGLIDVNIDGYSQSVSYTNQNTVGTIALASSGTELTADHIYFGPPTYQYIGAFGSTRFGFIDNIWIGDSAFPAGRVNARRWSIGSTSTDSGFAAVGTSPTTVPDALLLPTDAKAARGTGIGANTLITLAGGFDFTDMQEALIGVNVYLKRPAQLDAYAADRHIAVGLSISGVHTMDTVVAAEDLHVDNQLVPPNVNYTFGGLGGGVYGASLTQTNFPNTTIRLLVS